VNGNFDGGFGSGGIVLTDFGIFNPPGPPTFVQVEQPKFYYPPPSDYSRTEKLSRQMIRGVLPIREDWLSLAIRIVSRLSPCHVLRLILTATGKPMFPFSAHQMPSGI
jgi:hypothetical protein